MKFKNIIDIKAKSPEDLFQVNVKKIELNELEEGGEDKRFTYPFDIDYNGEGITRFEKESLEEVSLRS